MVMKCLLCGSTFTGSHYCSNVTSPNVSIIYTNAQEIPLIRRTDAERADYLEDKYAKAHLKLIKIKKILDEDD